MKLKNLNFEHGARSIVQMGEELISHPSTALLELIKNGYDADSIECKIYIHYDKNDKNTYLIIQDTGSGMDSKLLFGNWLKPSISEKNRGTKKSMLFQRTFLGSKGIGRLAAMALGKYVTVISKQSQDRKYNFIALNREIFKSDSLLKNVKFKGGESDDVKTIMSNVNLNKWKATLKNDSIIEKLSSSFITNFKKGTLIIIEQLDKSITTVIEDEFTDADINPDETSLVRSLRVFLTPLELNNDIQQKLIKKNILKKERVIAKKSNIFKILFGINILESEGESGFIPIKSISLGNYYNYRVYGKVLENGSVKGRFDYKRLSNDSYEEAFNLERDFVFSDEQLKQKRRPHKLIDEKFSPDKLDIGEFIFDIRIYDRGEKEILDKISKLLKTEGRGDARRYLNQFLGLRISKNGFGIKPYGEEEKDWMELSKMRVQNPGSVLNEDQILGYIYLFSPENDTLSEQTNREGFFENKEFIDFKKILRAILIESGRRRYTYRLKHGLGRTIRSQFDRPDGEEYMEFLKEKIKSKEILNRSKKFVEQVTTVLDNVEKSLNLSERLASIGSGLELIYHELAQPITQLGGVHYSLDLKQKYFTNEKTKADFVDDINSLANSLSTINTLKESLKPAIGISNIKDFKPKDTFRKVCFLFTKDINDFSVKILEDKAFDNYLIKDHEYALWIAFLNILNNSFYWLKYEDGNRTIKFGLETKNTIVISNNGPKIPEKELDRIFEYGVTFKKEKSATGLGLTYTRNILKRNNWRIRAENRNEGPAFLISKTHTNE